MEKEVLRKRLVGTHLGSYWVAGLLGQAPLGVVSSVEHGILGRPGLALIETGDTPAGTLLLETGKLIATLRHRHILPIHDLVTQDGLVALIFVAPGKSMEELVRERGVFNWREAIALVMPILSGMRLLNSHGLTFGRIRPKDVAISSTGVPRLVPVYGLRAADGDFTEEVCGAGELLYFLITGQHLSGRPGLDVAYTNLVMALDRATSPDATQRYKHVGQFALDLGVLLRDVMAQEPAPFDTISPGEALGPFVITAQLERRFMARIFRARHQKLGSRARLVVFHKTNLAAAGLEGQVRRRANVAASLHHPHIVPTTDTFETNDLIVYVQHIDWAESCRRRMLDRGPFRWPVACRIAQEIAEALRYCHERDVLHLDVRPENVLIDEEGRALLDNFFSARQPGQVALDGSVYLERSLAEQAPEITSGEKVTPATDIWGLGLTLYSLVTGARPFQAKDENDALKRLREGAFTSVRKAKRQIPEDLDLLLERLLAPQPEKRYQKAKDAGAGLAVILASAEPVSLPLTLLESTISVGPLGQHRIGAFSVFDVVGSGSYGDVYKVKREGDDRYYALKVLREQYVHSLRQVNRFERECEALQRISHPGVVRIFESGRIRDRPFLLMEFVSGMELSRKMADEGQIKPKEALEIASQLAEALGVVHEAGVIHRDLKPHNVLLADGRPIITDFGSAHIADGVRYTRTGEIIGSVAYMAPEQIDGRPLGPATDLYALGVVLFQMLTGQLPFDDENPYRVIERIRTEMPPRLAQRQVPGGAAIDSMLWKLLAKDPADRYSDGRVLATLLREVQSNIYK